MVILVATIVMLIITIITVIMLVLSIKKSNNYKELILQSIDGSEHLSTTISRELHDNIGQLLHLAKMSSKMNQLQQGKTTDNQADPTHDIIDKTIIEVKNLSRFLNSDYIKANSLVSSVEQFTNWVNSSEAIDCVLEVKGLEKAFEPKTELNLFRIFQEAIHNALKHSHASKIQIEISYAHSKFQLLIKDNGVGIDSSGITSSSGIGLNSMQARASFINSTLEIQSSPTTGTTITLRTASPRYI